MRTVSLLCSAIVLSGCATRESKESLHGSSIPASPEIAASVTGRTVRLIKIGAVFSVPASWIEKDAVRDLIEKQGLGWKTMYISPGELMEIEHGSGEWDTEYGEVINAILPFASCAMHGGDESWETGCSFADIQMRAYVGEWDLAEIQKSAAQDGVLVARRYSRDVHLSEAARGEWHLVSIRFRLWYSDYGGTASVDIYSRRRGSNTVALVFMHCADFPQQKAIDDILGSFAFPEEGMPNHSTEPTPGAVH